MARFRSRPSALSPLEGGTKVGGEELRFRDLDLKPTRHEAYRAGVPLRLSPLEYELLALMMRHPCEVFTRQQLCAVVWQVGDTDGRSNFVDAAVMSLRRKVELANLPRLIHTVRGYGYVLRDETRPESAIGEETGRHLP